MSSGSVATERSGAAFAGLALGLAFAVARGGVLALALAAAFFVAWTALGLAATGFFLKQP